MSSDRARAEPQAPFAGSGRRRRWAWGLPALAVVVVALVIFIVPYRSPFVRDGKDEDQRCQRNVQSILIGLMLYKSDHNVRSTSRLLTAEARDEWALALVKGDYLPRAQALWCPADRRLRAAVTAMKRTPSSANNAEARMMADLRELRRRIGRCSSYVVSPALSKTGLYGIEDRSKVVLIEEVGCFHEGYRVVGYADGSVQTIRTSAK